MVKHYIIMSSSYTDGTRIALDITEESLLNGAEIKKIIQEIQSLCDKDVPLSTHLIETESAQWDSVKAYDPFFEDVVCTDSVKIFAEKIKKGRTLTGLDVATYILTQVKCTHLSLEKLAYFAYADYLCSSGKKLFEDNIYAFSHGPVVESVYQMYKKSGYDYLSSPDSETSVRTGVKEMPAQSRILFAEDGADKLLSINQTLARYGKYSASTLVTLTHRKGSPWSHVDSSKPYQAITDSLIQKYHSAETA